MFGEHFILFMSHLTASTLGFLPSFLRANAIEKTMRDEVE